MSMGIATIEAMLVRAKAAHGLLDRGDLEGWAALEMILLPSEDVERASMTVARETGPSHLALQLSRKNWGPRKKRRPQLPKRMRDSPTMPRSLNHDHRMNHVRSEFVSIDELLLSL